MDDLDEDEESGAAQVGLIGQPDPVAGCSGDHPLTSPVLPEAFWRRGDGRSSGETQLAEFSHSGPGQPVPEHGRRQPDDAQAAVVSAGEAEGPDAGCGAAHRGGQ